MTRVAITGLGFVSALGPDLSSAWPRLMAGVNGVAPISRFDARGWTTPLAAQVPDDVLSREARSKFPRVRLGTWLFFSAVREAVHDAGLAQAGCARDRVGVAAGASVNYLHLGLLRDAWTATRGATRGGQRDAVACEHPDNDFWRRQGDEMAALPARAHGWSGPRLVLDTACSASAHAIAAALREIRHGRADAMVAGGGCSLVQPISVLAFSRIGALSTNPNPDRASRPFDRDRDGFVMGEGGAAIVIETMEHAVRRGARIYAELAGAGQTTTAASLTDPSVDGAPEARAMTLALDEAGLVPDDVDLVVAHGTSTQRNDMVETLAIKRALGRRAHEVAVSSPKGQIGHTLAAAGACNVVIAAMAIARGEVPPTAHLENPDPECDLDYVPRCGRTKRVRASLAHAFAFGGHNVAIALRAC
jgi:3-oxoacyl-[acyl-carrier-protein] synthase II